MQHNETIKAERREYEKPPGWKMSKVYQVGSLLEVTTLSNPQINISGLRRGNEHYRVDKETGEVFEFPSYQTRRDNIDSIHHTYDTLRRTIHANFTGGTSELCIVLTFSKEQTVSSDDLYTTFGAFWKRFTYRYPGCDYIAVPEPHEDGRWHFHLLVKKRDGQILYVPHEELETVWGHGFVKAERIQNVSSLALYLSTKYRTHPARLSYFPARFRLYRLSHGIVSPATLKIPRKEVDELIRNGGYRLDNAYCVDIQALDPTGERIPLNTITREYFSSQEIRRR